MWCYGFIYTGFNSQTIKNASRAADKIMIEDKAVAEHLARVLPRFVLRTFPFSILYEPSDELKKAVKEVERPEWSAFEISLYRVENGVPGVEIFSTVRFRQPPRLMHLVQESLPEIQDGITLKTVRLDGIEPVTIGFTPAPGRTNSGVVAVIRPRYALADGAFDLVFEKDVFPAFPSFSVALYQQDQLLHRFFHGVAKPEFVADPVLTASGQGSSFIPEFAKDGFRSVVFPYRNGEAILLAFPDLGLSDHAFAAVRFFLVVIITLLAIYTILLVVFQKVPDFLATRQRLQLRILDSYILSSLMFLVLLIIVTHVAVQRRASAEFRRNFEQKLEEYRQELSRTPYLEWLDKAYNGDYLLFEGPFLLTSSRMQLTQNGLLPETLPYSIMARMSEEMQPRFIRSFTLAGVPIQAGILRLNAGDKQKDPFYIVIPAYEDTYSQAEYLFKTTGFLIIIYTALFGFFIAGAAFISRHLSRPLADLSSGLRRVATGEFSTTVPVTTQDEIGDLANAYNLMIYKLQDLQRELAEAERQAALSEMARQVAHEIKNPLTPMKLSIQFLQRQIMQRDKPLEELQEAVNRICQTVVEQIDSLNAIASDFSRFAKPVNGIFMKTDINRVATDIIDLYRHDRRITIIPDLNETPLYVHAVGDELKRVFINLVKNSDEAMPEGGVLIIRTYAFKDLVYAEVVDNGVGIPVEMQGRIFTPNFSTKTSGTGLGLAICKKIVEAHKGEIGFASVPGTGTTFTLIFPAWKETDGMRAALPEGAV
jgi:signal transduction histidine kinase